MVVVEVEALTFYFEIGWKTEKYDTWQFYQKNFQKIRSGVKAIDVFALSPEKHLFLIEVKDYRAHPRTKPSEITNEVSCKVFDSLAGLLPAKLNAFNSSEKNFAARALAASKIKIILHLEQPLKHSKLFPRAIDPASVQTQLRQTLKAIDPHARVTETNSRSIRWTVTQNRS
jgi:hypothetical protein